jgi:hypothetical protein
MTQFMDFFTNSDEIVGKSWEIRKTIDNAWVGGVKILRDNAIRDIAIGAIAIGAIAERFASGG